MSYPPEHVEHMDQLLAEAKRRGVRRRSLRRAGFGAGALFVAAAVIFALVVFVMAPGPTRLDVVSPRSPSPVPTTPVPSPALTPTPSPAKTPTPGSPAAGGPPMYFGSIAFGTPLDGWAAGLKPVGSGEAVVVSHSVDGGLRWSPATTVSRSAGSLVAPGAHVRFTDALHGWVTGGPDLFATSNGGRTWTDTGVSGVAGAVTPAGGTVWALQYPCPATTSCAPRLIESVLPDGAWHPVAQQPSLLAGPAALLRVTASEAFITSLNPLNPQVAGMLVKTTDGGATWQALPDPCGPGTEADPLASLDGVTVWMACAGQPGAGSQAKQLYVSANGGRSWALKASVGLTTAGPGGLTSSGYVSKLALSSATTGFLALSRYGLAASSDGGTTWRGLGAWDGAGGNFWALWFVDASHGWAAACDGLHRTTDGGATWSLIGTWPAGGQCGG